MNIRAAQASDAAAIAALSGQLGYAAGGEEIASRLAALRRESAHEAFVAEAEGTVVGWIHVFLRPTLESPLMAEIGGLVVGESSRRRGAGRALVEAAHRWGHDHGAKALTVRCNELREAGNRFYAALGFACSKTQTVWRRPV